MKYPIICDGKLPPFNILYQLLMLAVINKRLSLEKKKKTKRKRNWIKDKNNNMVNGKLASAPLKWMNKFHMEFSSLWFLFPFPIKNSIGYCWVSGFGNHLCCYFFFIICFHCHEFFFPFQHKTFSVPFFLQTENKIAVNEFCVLEFHLRWKEGKLLNDCWKMFSSLKWLQLI